MQLSLLEQARLEIPTASDAERVAILAQRVIAELDAKPPIDLEMVASWQGVDKIDVADIPGARRFLHAVAPRLSPAGRARPRVRHRLSARPVRGERSRHDAEAAA